MVIPRMSRPAAPAMPKRPAEPPPVEPTRIAQPKTVVKEPEFAQEFSVPASFMETKPSARRVPMFAIVLAGALLMGGIVFFAGGSAVLGGRTPVNADANVQLRPLLPAGVAGWSVVADWPRHISLLRGYGDITDFRMEFEGSIDNKALGWVFRASDARNYYAMKLEIVTPGRDPVVVLKRFAVINGKDQDTMQIPLPATTRLDTLYKIRLEAQGPQFTTWISDRKADQWIDSRLSQGAIGLFNDGNERGVVKGDVKIFHLERK
jgi:hypothetical protein